MILFNEFKESSVRKCYSNFYVNGCMIIYNIFLPIKAALRDRVEVTALSPHTKRRVKIILRSTFCMWRHHSE